MSAKELYELGCDAYLQQFCEKHGFNYERNCWVGNDVGGVACVGDYFFDMATIRTDIDEDAPEHELIAWYDYCLEAHEYGITQPNFHSWIHGCPRTQPSTFERMRELKKELNELADKENGKVGQSF